MTVALMSIGEALSLMAWLQSNYKSATVHDIEDRLIEIFKESLGHEYDKGSFTPVSSFCINRINLFVSRQLVD